MEKDINLTAEKPENSWSTHFRSTLALGLPLIGAQLAQMGINFTDTLMIGWLGSEQLAASVLATTMVFVVMVCGFGLANAVMPLTAQALGEGDTKSLRRSVRMGLWVVGLFSILMMPILWFSEDILLLIGQKPELASQAQDYIRIVQWSLLPAMVVAVLRSYLSSLERTQIILWITLIGVLVNAYLNYALIFGNFGAPRLELRGAAIASLLTNFISMGLAVAYCWLTPALRQHEVFVRFWRSDWEAFRQVLKLGIPISLMLLAEVGLFAISSFMMGWVGTIELAAHGIALQVTSISFMIPLSFANVGTVRVGRAVGKKDAFAVGRAGQTVVYLGIGFALFAAVVFILLPEQLISIYLRDDNPDIAAIILYGVPLLAVAAAFQVVDTMQALAAGLLRGLQDTKIPMYIAIFSYWAVGIPAAYVLGFILNYGGVGIWSGLAIGLSVAAVLLSYRFYNRKGYNLIEF